MELLYARCAGLDVHKKSVTAAVRIAEGGEVRQSVEEFATTTRGLLELSEFLSRHGVTHVGMEATGVYWRPVWHILEGHFTLMLANAAHVKNVPGRKTDVKDAVWLADLMAHGLIRSSFVPPEPVQELRQLTRTRKQLIGEITQHTLRLQKVLEDTNIKVTNVVTDLMGVTGRAILRSLISGETDPQALADHARGKLKNKREELVEALHGRVTEHHRFMLQLHLGTLEMLEQRVAEIDERLGGALEPFRVAVEQLKTIPGVAQRTAEVLVSEIGADMSRFPTAQHLVSWAGLCPRNDESAGKKRSTRLRKSSRWLKATLIQAAWGATHKKDGYLRAQYLRLKARRGPKRAVVAVAASMLVAAWNMLRDGTSWEDLGGQHFTIRNKAKVARNLSRRLEALGFVVTLQPAA
jgi:transposase